jgi:hypothetical protein
VKTPDLEAIEAVDCADLDFGLTHRCTITADGATLVCAVRKEVSAEPYCITGAQDEAEAERRDALVGRALAAARAQGRLAFIVTGLRTGEFTIGCALGFRTVANGSAQTDDVVVDLIAVSTATGRSFWTTLTFTPAGDVDEMSGVDPSEKPAANGYGGCDLAGDGTATARPDHRDAALLPTASAS